MGVLDVQQMQDWAINMQVYLGNKLTQQADWLYVRQSSGTEQ